MRLLFDLAMVVPILVLALAAEPYVKGGAGRVLVLQWLVKMVTLGVIVCAYFLEKKTPALAPEWPRETGLIIWASAALIGQVFIMIGIGERNGRALKLAVGRRFFQIGRSLQSALGLSRKESN